MEASYTEGTKNHEGNEEGYTHLLQQWHT